MKTQFDSVVANLHPAYFSLVMATGIVSIASHLLDFAVIARTLLWLNLPFYLILVCATFIRIVRHPKRVHDDLWNHQRGVGFFTAVAGTAVLGNQFLILVDAPILALGFWIFALTLWIPLTYSIFTIYTVKTEKPSLANGINGGWLVAVVASQSVALLAALLSSRFPQMSIGFLFFSLVVWLAGGMLYLWITVLIFYRYSFFPMSPTELAPPYWINMGAMAISVLTGTALIAESSNFHLLKETLPFLKGLTLLFWSTATWWIPLLLMLGVWRHLIKRVPLQYDPVYWSLVFPLGMYCTCTYRLSKVLELPDLAVIYQATIYIAWLAWLVTMIGLVARIAKYLRVSVHLFNT